MDRTEVNYIQSADWTRNWNGKVSTKITSILIWLSIVTGLIVTGFKFYNYENKIQEQFTKEKVLFGHKLKSLASKKEIEHYLNIAKEKYLFINDYSFEEPPAANNFLSFDYTMDRDYKTLYISQPSIKGIYQSHRNTWMGLFIVLLLLESFIIKSVIMFIMSNPHKKLIEAIEHVQNGGLNTRLDDSRDDEFGEISRHFNIAMNSIEEAQVSLKESEQRANAANNSKTIFLANMSHEIRTPLTSILGFAQEVLNKGRIAPNERKNLETITRNTNHLMNIINEILDMSKIEQEKMKVEIVDSSLQKIVDDVCSLSINSAKSKGLECNLDVQFPLPETILTDPTRVKQVLINVLSNAIKFTHEGSVSLTVKYEDERLVFTIEDTGIGMSPDKLAKIFEPFTQADDSTTRKYGGTGLGLCISKNILSLLDGKIHVDSTPNVGTVFNIYLPVKQAIQNKLVYNWNQQESERTIRYNIENMTGSLLIVEDTEDIAQLIHNMIKDSKADVSFAANGLEAIEKTQQNNYDLVLMDAQMPVMGGIEATKKIRANGYEGPIVFLSANVMKDDIEQYIEAGSNDQISKPINQNSFYEILGKYLGNVKTFEMKAVSHYQDEKLNKFIESYRSKMPAKIETLSNVLEELNFEDLYLQVHSLRGSSGSFGFKKIFEKADDFEMYLKSLQNILNEYMNELQTACDEECDVKVKKTG
jgi:signal transduction histidine kinase/DNA-binding response OmpR family regulator